MKYIRGIVEAFLVVLGLIFIGELYCLHVTSFSGMKYIVFDDIYKGGYETRFENVQKVLSSYQIDICVIDDEYHGDGTSLIHLYCNGTIKEKMKSSGWYEGTVYSMFGGSTTVTYSDITEFTKRDKVSEQNDILLFYDGVITDLKGVPFDSFEPLTKDNNPSADRKFALIIWMFVCVVVLFLEEYAFVLEKKEWMIKLYYGFPGGRILLSRMMEEIVVMLIVFGFPVCIFWKFISLQYIEKIAIISLSFLLLFELISICFFYFHTDIKKVFGREHFSHSFITVSYVMRGIIVIFAVIMLGESINSVNSLLPLIKEEDFYRQFERYSHIQLITNTQDLNIDRQLMNEFFVENADTCDITEWFLLQDNFANKDGDETRIIYANYNADRIISNLFDKEQYDFFEENKIYVFLPDGFEIYNLSEQSNEVLYKQAILRSEAEVIYISYHKKIKTCAFVSSGIGGEKDTVPCENPIIIYSTVNSFEKEDTIHGELVKLTDAVLLINEDELINEINSNSFFSDYYYTDIYQSFCERIASTKRMMLIWLVLAVFTIIFDVYLVLNMVRMEHSMNSMELSIKKVMGTPLLVRYAKIMKATLLIYAIGLTVSEMICYICFTSFSFSFAFSAVMVFFVEICITLLEISKWNHESIPKILKGGCL